MSWRRGLTCLLIGAFLPVYSVGQGDDRKDCSSLLEASTVLRFGCTVGAPPNEEGQPVYLIGSDDESFGYNVECVDRNWARYAGPFTGQPIWHGQCVRFRIVGNEPPTGLDCRPSYYSGRVEAYSPSDFNNYFVRGQDGLAIEVDQNMAACTLGSTRVAAQEECQGRECDHCDIYGECQYFRSDPCFYHTGCPNGYVDNGSYCCVPACPLLIDLGGNGFLLTSLEDGLSFDIDGNGIKKKISWTASGVPNACLVLDRNKNGIIDDGRELFGNFSPQTASANPNGFLALSEFDKLENGGNSNGSVDAEDAVFPTLRLWLDSNHDAISQPAELLPLVAAGLKTIDLKYHESKVTDQYGNQFRYRAKLLTNTNESSKWAWDVFLLVKREESARTSALFGKSCPVPLLKE